MDFLAGIKQDLRQEISDQRSYTIAPQITTTTSDNRTYAPQLSYQYNPILQLGSPNASASGAIQTPSIQVLPSVNVAPALTPNTTQGNTQTQDNAGGNSMTDMLIAGAAILAGIVILPPLIKSLGKFK